MLHPDAVGGVGVLLAAWLAERGAAVPGLNLSRGPPGEERSLGVLGAARAHTHRWEPAQHAPGGSGVIHDGRASRRAHKQALTHGHTLTLHEKELFPPCSVKATRTRTRV